MMTVTPTLSEVLRSEGSASAPTISVIANNRITKAATREPLPRPEMLLRAMNIVSSPRIGISSR